jgi:hypothetical protein
VFDDRYGPFGTVKGRSQPSSAFPPTRIAEIRHSAGPPRRPATFPFLFESAEIATFTPQEKIKLEFDMRTERDLKNQIAYAKKEGREEGREEERIRIVENLRKLGISEEKIASAIEAK